MNDQVSLTSTSGASQGDRLKDAASLEAEANAGKTASQQAAEKAKAAQEAAAKEKTQGTQETGMGQMNMMMGAMMGAQGAAMIGQGQFIMGASGMTWGTAAGLAMIAAGTAMAVQGEAKEEVGNTQVASGTEKLAQAAEEKTISKEQGKIASKEMQRSEILEQKLSMLKSMQASLGENFQDSNLSQKDIEKLQASGMDPTKMSQDQTDKMFGAAADSLVNKGIMTLQDKDGKDMHFIKDESGDFYQVQVKNTMEGTLELDSSAEKVKFDLAEVDILEDSALEDNPELDPEKLANLSEEDADQLRLFGELLTSFTIADGMRNSISGANGGDRLGKLETFDLGNDQGVGFEFRRYNIDNTQDMKQYANIVRSTEFAKIQSGEVPPPLKVTNGEGYDFSFQKWDWDLTGKTEGKAAGEKFSLYDLILDPKKSTSALGMEPGSALYDYWAPTIETESLNEYNYQSTAAQRQLSSVASSGISEDGMFGSMDDAVAAARESKRSSSLPASA